MKLGLIYIALLTAVLGPAGWFEAPAPASHPTEWALPLPDDPCFEDSTDTRVRIEQANLMTREQLEGEPVQILTGNVRMCQEDTRLRANRVIRYLERDEVLLLGNVRIVERGDTLNARRVLYNSARKEGLATGDVRLSDGEVQVFAPSALYFAEEKRTQFTESVRLVDSMTVLTSEEGEYFSDEKRAEFAINVVLDEDRTHLEADSVTYYRETEVSIGRGRVFIERIGGDEDAEPDSTLRTFLFGDRAYNDNQIGYSRIDGHAVMVQFKIDSTATEVDTLLMAASRLEAERRDSLQRLTAVDSVRIWRHAFAALADSAVYDRVDVAGMPLEEDNRLFLAPLAWYEQYQISGDTIRASATGGSVDSLWVRNNAFTAHMDTTLNRVNQLKGAYALGLFDQDSLRSLATWPQAQTIYFMADENNVLSEAVQASSDSLTMAFENNEPRRLHYDAGIQGTSYPAPLIPSPLQLEGFRWEPERRPSKASMLALLPEEPMLPEVRYMPAAQGILRGEESDTSGDNR